MAGSTYLIPYAYNYYYIICYLSSANMAFWLSGQNFPDTLARDGDLMSQGWMASIWKIS